MVIKSSIFGFLSLLCLSQLAYCQKSLFIGHIQFPNVLAMVPSIRVYYAGQRIPCENNNDSKNVTYSIPEFKERAFFYLLISHDIEFCSHQNTVPFLKLKCNCPYKFYALQRIAFEAKNKKKKNESKIEYSWLINELNLGLPDGRIPDETIIVRYNPEYIQALEGGNAIEFPKIIIKNDILQLVGSEDNLHDISNRWFLAALNTDTIHSTVQPEFIMSPQSKTVIAMTA